MKGMSDRNPVVLVQGWNSHLLIWKNLCISLEDEGILNRKFDRTTMKGAGLPYVALDLS